MKKSKIKLDPRLSLAASFVKDGGVAADIGTDHAYIPIYLITEGICKKAIASDINEGPLMRAKANSADYGVENSIYFALTDGLDGLPLEEMSVTDIIICGMGGELIARIINDSEYAKKADVNLILQPMSSIEELRYYLAGNGFRISDEGICTSQGKIYQCINCTYDGIKRSITPAEAALGKINIEKGCSNPHFLQLLKKITERTTHIIKGKENGGNDTEDDKKLLYELISISEKQERIYDCN